MTARERLLEAAHDAVVSGAWPRVRMADLARAAGVSRQTLYNEFGSRDGLAATLAAREGERFLAGALAAFAASPGGPAEALGAAAGWALRSAAHDPVVTAAVTDDAGGLLPLLTTRSEPLLLPIAAALAQAMVARDPRLDAVRCARVAETVVRLTVSHLVLPTQPVDASAVDLALTARALLA
ncbi:MAG: TetR family transcriptional regulator [Actinomycetia bacterium]|nr:TetR family transcriptional regulator [Actinomycetes bacterium]